MDVNINQDNNPNPSCTPAIEDRVLAIEIRTEAQDPSTFPPAASRPPSISVNPHHQIRFRHPHYPDSSNVLLTLFAPDSPAGGIEFGVAHAACGVISGNRWEGWFTTTIDGAKSTLTYGDILCERDYYFYLPNSSLETPYAIVPTFREWTFPHEDLHPCWQTHHDNIPSAQNSRFAAISSLSAAIFIRDQSCRMSGFTEGTQAAHLCPRSEDAWFQRNEMSRYNLNPLLVSQGPLEDTANALLLRQDLHTHFDAHKFVFVPKKSKSITEREIPIVAHLLMASRELGILHHNVRLKAIPDVDMAFLFTRFAWSMFTLLTGFLRVGVERRLIGTTISTPSGLPHILSAADCKSLVPGGSKSRSRSPTKRQRRRSDAEIDAEIKGEAYESGRPHKRQRRNASAGEESHEGSDSTESSKAIPTPTCMEAIDSLRDTWLQKERLRSDPDNKWSEEQAWATNIRDGDQVMDPADVQRYYRFMGHELKEGEPDP
ncbi:hypothetical protein BJ875DRAFT_260735 [Amylocarpus encephaloides]|uniref:HNH nuclease domain-containing protein n=1 Tax=Amylocarpus encephaloides TaxID=45428 RepID=A0A9P8C839_9HELO|nr:hypothetical protein BJ875DRAFT_260735 [Amylocarpus encephaloides]